MDHWARDTLDLSCMFLLSDYHAGLQVSMSPWYFETVLMLKCIKKQWFHKMFFPLKEVIIRLLFHQEVRDIYTPERLGGLKTIWR